MKMDRNEIIKNIDAAFAGVALEDGIGIFEAIAMDYCVSDKKREEARKNDVREDLRLELSFVSQSGHQTPPKSPAQITISPRLAGLNALAEMW